MQPFVATDTAALAVLLSHRRAADPPVGSPLTSRAAPTPTRECSFTVRLPRGAVGPRPSDADRWPPPPTRAWPGAGFFFSRAWPDSPPQPRYI